MKHLAGEAICRRNGEYSPTSTLPCTVPVLRADNLGHKSPSRPTPTKSPPCNSLRPPHESRTLTTLYALFTFACLAPTWVSLGGRTIKYHGQLRLWGPMQSKTVIGAQSIYRIEVGRGSSAVASLRAIIIARLFLSTSPSCIESSQATLVESHQPCLELQP